MTNLNCGDLHDYATGQYIRPATLDELSRSLDAAMATCDGTGVIRVDGRSVYVEGESNEAHKLAGGAGLAE